MKLRTFRLMAPETGDPAGGATEPDRGDTFEPTPEAEEKPDAAKAEPEKVEQAAKEEGTARALPDALSATDTDEKAAKKGGAIPLDRHREILQKERDRREALERELASTRQGQQLAKSNEDLAKAEDGIATMEKEYIDLLAKGDVAAAQAKMTQIRHAERAISEQKSEASAQQAEARAYARVKYEATVERLEAAYPAINPDHADYDEAQTRELVELRDAYMATGKYSAPEAIQKAAKQLLRAETKKQEAATSVDVRVSKDDVAEKLREERKSEAVKRNVDAAGKQPPAAVGIGQDSDKAGGKLVAADVVKMNQKQFAKLSEADLAVMRGDAL